MDLARDCIKLIRAKLAKEISKDEYYIGIIELDKKYPGIGFYDTAQQYANRNIRKASNVIDFKSRSTGEREAGEEG